MSPTTRKKSREPITATAPHQVQQASAGTGKTFALSNRFLKLMARGAAPNSILAATFTRKGAGEILDRVMGRLCQAAGNVDEADRLSGFLGVSLTAADALKLLRVLTVNFHCLQMGTIDSFFHRLARVLSLDLGLPLNWDIAEPSDLAPLVNQALGAMLGDQEVVDLLQLIARGDADRAVAARALETINGTYQLFLETLPTAWTWVTNFPPVPDTEVRAYLERWRDLSVADSRQNKRWHEDLDLLALVAWDDLVKSAPLTNVANGSNRYYVPLPEQLVAAYREMIGLVSRAVVHEIGRRTAAAGQLAERYAQEMLARQRRQGLLRFDDVTRLLSCAAPEIDHAAQSRLDTRIEHVLLDEFQDTSPSQWQVLRPIIERVTAPSGQGSFYCVGDKKQAIYAWRGGVAEMFDVVEERLAGRLEPCEPLVESRRSAPPIMDTVNRVFQNLTSAGQDDRVGQEMLATMQASFPTHRTALASMLGYVAVERVPALNDPELTSYAQGEEAVLQRVVEEVCRAHQTKPNATVAVLMRGNAHIAWLVHELQLRGVPASEEGGNPLTDSAAVDHVLSALQLIDHPHDGPTRFHVSHGPLAGEFGLAPETGLTAENNLRQVQTTAARWRRVVASIDLAGTIERWATVLAPHCSARDLLRLQQLIELAEARGDNHRHRPGQFVQHVRETPVAEPSTAPIRVMTIHAAKGLEFDIVFAPMLSQRSGWTPSSPAFVSRRPLPELPIDAVCRWANESQRNFLPPDLQAMFDENYRTQVRDELCVLYVMLTRAAHELRIFIPEKAKAKHNNATGVVLATLAADGDDAIGVLYECGQADWYQVSPRRKAAESGPSEFAQFYLSAEILATLPHRKPRREVDEGLTHLTTSEHTDNGDVISPALTSAIDNIAAGARSKPSEAVPVRKIPRLAPRIERETNRSMGRLIHACLEQIDWLDDDVWELIRTTRTLRARQDVLPIVAVVAKAARLNDGERSALHTAVCAVLCQEGAERIFRRDTYLEWILRRFPHFPSAWNEALRLTVANEQRLAGRLDGLGLVEGVVDRWVSIYEGNQLLGAHVVDFKTDQVSRRHVGRQAAKYRRQVAAYCRLVADFSRLDSSAVLGDLYFTQPGMFFAVGETETVSL